MTDPIEINRRNWDERAIIHARDMTGFYTLGRVRSGEDRLHSIEAAELGEKARRLDALAPGAVQPRLRDGRDGGQRHPRGECLAERRAVVVAATAGEEDAVPPRELQLAVAGPSVAAHVDRIGRAEGRVVGADRRRPRRANI